MRIQDVELSTGLDRATIRYYEKEGLLQPRRAENGYRCYEQEDIQLLLKIKLLRNLGVSLSTIKALQKGSEEFAVVLAKQIEELEDRIQSDSHARAVCIEMRNDGTQYETLDSTRYLQMLYSANKTANFHEQTNTEQHPIRRFVARILDVNLISAVFQFLVIVILRMRPCTEGALMLVRILSYALAIPAEAAMLCLWGFTPGKWLMGIRLEDPNGGPLRFLSAFSRTWHATLFGLGLYIPLIQLWRLWRCYTDVSNGKGTYWEEEADFQYKDFKISNICGAVFAVSLIVFANYYSSQDAILPTYRSDDLKMSQFIDNYQDYEKLFQADNTMVLDDKGMWKKRTNTDVEIIQIGDGSHERQDFQYTLNNNGGITSIYYQDSWSDITFMDAMPDYCRMAIYTVVGSQPGSSSKDLLQVDEYLDAEFGESLEKGGMQTGNFQVSDVKVIWTVQLPEKEIIFHDGMLFSVDEEPLPYSLGLEIIVE